MCKNWLRGGLLERMTRYMRYWDDLSLTQLLMGRIGHPKKDRLAEYPVLAFILSLKTVPNVSAYRSDSLFQEQLSV